MSPQMYSLVFPLLWLCWAAYWLIRARDVKQVVRIESRASRYGHVLPLVVAGLLVGVAGLPVPFLERRLWPWHPWQFWAGAALTSAGLLFAVWARLHIGRNWSGMVTVKQDHELITGGPYALVRHPIYTGLLAAFAGSALARGEWRGILAVVIVFFTLWRKLRLEERFMREQFGPAYDDYSRRVRALLPWLL
ncbi:MAG: isoprenylcysteine carboxylmethyltransferase family protein [Steroidobacteraceae bacterium]